MSTLLENFETIRSNIKAACARVGRKDSSVKILIVTKNRSPLSVQQLAAYCQAKGYPVLLGENYVQEYKTKKELFAFPHVPHLIGPLQRNKAKDAVALFSIIESVHSVEVAQAIHRAAAKIAKVQDVFLQVNVSDDPAKSGFATEQVEQFLKNTAPALSHIQILGLMTITKLYENAAEARPDFKKLYDLKEQLGTLSFELSMGMSNDYEIAIEEGATVVRIGSAIWEGVSQ